MEGTGDKGYVTGDGRVAQFGLDERGTGVLLTGEDLEGEPIDIEDYRGEPLVVVLWGSWCTPCRAEAPDVVAAARDLEGTAGFLGLNIRDSSTAQAQAFARTQELPYRSVFSPDGRALLAFGGAVPPNAIPSFVVLDSHGRIAASIIGELPSRTTLVELTEEVAAEDG